MKKSLLVFSFIYFIFGINNKAVACSPLNVPTLTSWSVTGGNLVLNWTGNTIYACPDFVEVEIVCGNQAFTGTGPFFGSSVMTYSPPAAYPTQTISLASFCAGTAYQFRARERNSPAGTFSGWTSTYTFTTPGVFVQPTLTVTASPTSICPPATSQLNVVINNACGTTAPTYSWSPTTGLSNPNIANPVASPAVATTYTVTVTGGQTGCWTATGSVSITISGVPTAGTASLSPSSVCSGGTTTLTLTGNVGAIQWQSGPTSGGPWTNISGATTSPYTTGPISANTCYQAVVTGCSSVTSNAVCVTISPPPTITVPDASVCAGQNVTLTATPSTMGGTYSWAPGGEITQSITVNPVVTTTYTVTYNLGGCIATDAGTVTINPAPTVTVNNATVCNGTSAVLTATPSTLGGTYLWSPGGQNTQSITVSPSSTTTYSVLYDLGGCTNTGTGTVTVNAVPTLSVSNTTICSGTPGTITATPDLPGGTFLWNTGDVTASLTQSPVSTTTYTVTYTLSGCTSPTASGTMTVGSPTSANFTVNSVCQSNAVVPNNTSVLANTYSWNFGDGSPLDANQNPTHNYSTDGIYTITLIASSNGACADTITQTVNIFPMPNAAFSAPAVCEGNTTNFTDMSTISSGTITSWSWNFGDGGVSALQNPTHAYANDNCFDVFLAIATNNGCTDNVIQNICVNELPVASFTATSPCEGTATVFSNNSTVSSGTISYGWSFGDATTSIVTDPTHLYSGPGTFNVDLVVTTNNGCVSTVTVPVNVNAMPVANFVPDITSSCSPLCANFSDMSTISSGTISSWSWNFGDGTPNSALQDPNHCYFNSTGGILTFDVTLTVTSAAGCQNTDVQAALMTVYPNPIADFTAAPQPTTVSNPLITFTNTSLFGGTYTWDFGDGNTSTQTDPTNIYLIEGIYDVTLVTVSPFGCIDSITQPVEIKPDFLLYVPNAFTPNGDGTNDLFFPYIDGFDPLTFEFMIFNRWGELVYETTNSLTGWDGNHKAIKAKQDTYVWKIKVKDKETQNIRVFYGHVNLLR